VTFAIGDLVFPTVMAAPQISPVELGLLAEDPVSTTTNIARLLQSLDNDGDTSNGIFIAEIAATSATAINFDVPITQFAINSAVTTLVANSGSSIVNLISEIQAIDHLESTLNQEVSAVNGVTDLDMGFTREMLQGRTMIATNYESAASLAEYPGILRFNTADELTIVGLNRGRLRDGTLPWSIDSESALRIDFSEVSFSDDTVIEDPSQRFLIQSTDAEVLRVERTFNGESDGVINYTLSKQLSASDLNGMEITVNAEVTSSSLTFFNNSTYELVTNNAITDTGTYSDDDIDGVSLIQSDTDASILFLTQGTLEDGVVLRWVYGVDEFYRVIRLEFFETNGATWNLVQAFSADGSGL